MIFGGLSGEHIVLNEKTMWSGSVADADRQDAFTHLSELQRLVFADQNHEAQHLVNQNFTCKNEGSGHGRGKEKEYGCYQTLGFLDIEFSGLAQTSDYVRRLDLSQALVTVQNKYSSGTMTRTAFVSAADSVLVYRITHSELNKLDFKVSLSRPERATITKVQNDLTLTGTLPNGRGGDGISFYGRLAVVHDGQTDAGNDDIRIHAASTATLYFSAATDMHSAGHEERVNQILQRAIASDYESILARHLLDFRSKFDRVTLHLPARSTAITTPERVERCGNGEDDPAISSLYFHFGRYLLLSSSREEDLLPANLQGIWAEELQTPWNGDFHLDINVQMNYWPAEVANMAECHLPLIRFVQNLVPNGRKTAAAYYASKGWVAHVITNPWYFTSPGEDADWGAFPGGGAWLCQHLWTHYEYGQDQNYLRNVYPVLKEAAEFFCDFLIKDPKSGWLVTNPSISPENHFFTAKGETVAMCAGPTMDSVLIRELFNNTITAAGILGVDSEWIPQLRQKLEQLPPYQIGQFGQLQEWLEDYPEAEPTHRHFSHLYGLFPGSDIGEHHCRDITNAARISLIRRGKTSTGWATAWKACCWARLKDAQTALEYLKKLTSPRPSKSDVLAGGSYPNLFCIQPPFQIDGNFGGAAAVCEMLLQSHEQQTAESLQESYVIHFLPALPASWDYGHFSGLRVRGNLAVSAKWQDSTLQEIEITSPSTRNVYVRYGDELHQLPLLKGANRFTWNVQENNFAVSASS